MNALSRSEGTVNTPAQRPEVQARLRSRVVEILSNTANGCLTELGYHPGIAQKIKELEKTNTEWQQENLKLYQDNQRLTQMVLQQKRQWELATGPEIYRLDTIHALEIQAKQLMAEKLHLQRQNEALISNQSHDVQYQRLHADYTKLWSSYNAALNEISRLRHRIQVISNRQNVQQTALSQTADSRPNTITQNSPMHPSPPCNDSVSTTQTEMVQRTQEPGPSHNLKINPPTVSMTVPNNSYPHITSTTVPISPDESLNESSHPPLSIQITTLPRHQNHQLPPTPISNTSSPQCSPDPATPLSKDQRPPTPLMSSLRQSWTPDPMELCPAVESLYAPISKPPPAELSETTSTSISNATPISSPMIKYKPLKRESVDMSDVFENEDQQHKRQRLETPESIVRQSESQDLAQGKKLDQTDNKDEDENEEGESDGGIIEVGPDGLRLVEDCVSALIDEDEENDELQNCRLCNARFEAGHTSEKPEPFHRATMEDLIHHCSTEHQAAWEALRHGLS